MFDLIQRFFGTDDFMPHGMCFLWRPDMIAAHVISDAVIALSYFSIPVFLYYFARKRAGLQNIWVLHLFAAFILLCGLTHVMGIVVLWFPEYGTQAVIKILTAGVSAITAVLVWFLFPILMAIPSPGELRDANNRLNIFKRVLEAAQFGILINKTRKYGGDVVYCNPLYADMAGVPQQEIVGRNIDELTDKLFQYETLGPLYEGLNKGIRATSVVTMAPPNAEPFQDEVSMAPVAGDDGEHTHWVSFNIDVSERIKSEDAVRDSEDLFRAAFESTPQGFALLTTDGEWIRVNQALCGMLDYTEAELRALHFRDITHAEDVDNDADDIQSLLVGDSESYSVEKRYLRKDGTVFPAQVGVSLVRDKGGEPLRFVVQLFDLTEIKQARIAIKQSERLYHAIERNTDIAIFVEDMTGMYTYMDELRQRGVTDLLAEIKNNQEVGFKVGEGIKLQDVNEAGMKLLGAKTFGDVLEFGFFKRPETQHSVGPMLKAMYDRQPTARGEATFQTIDGREISVVYSLPVPHSKEEASYVPLLVVEVSELRRAEAALAASRAKSEFLATMSHEIRSPLNAIIGNIELIGHQTLNAETESMVREVNMASKSLLALIGNILDFSKIEAGALSIESRLVDPSGPLKEAVEVMQGQARQKNLSLTCTIDPDVPHVGAGDGDRLRQILLNLIGNAVKFTKDGGVWASASVVEQGGASCLVLYDVYDSGIGFSDEDRENLFKPFRQAESSGRSTTEGTGLGLTIARSLVEEVGGEIGCESVEGFGSHFWFTWPFSEVTPAPSALPVKLNGVIVEMRDHPRLGGIMPYFENRQATVHLITQDGHKRSNELSDLFVQICDEIVASDPVPSFLLRSTISIAVVPDKSLSEASRALRMGYQFVVSDEDLESIFDGNLGRLMSIDGDAQSQEIGQPAAADEQLKNLQGGNLLVLEDRPANQLVIRRQLTSLGISCTMAENGKYGLNILESSSAFDAILCDCAMPIMDGFAFTQALRKQEAERDAERMPIIALTANAFREDIERCYAAGMDDFISKPVTLQDLASTLGRWVNSGTELKRRKEDKVGQAQDLAIDVTVIESIFGADDKEGVILFLAEIVKSAPGSFKAVADAASRSAGADLVDAAHAAKGEAANAGALRLSDLYQRLESDAKAGSLGDVDRRLADIETELNRVVDMANKLSSD